MHRFSHMKSNEGRFHGIKLKDQVLKQIFIAEKRRFRGRTLGTRDVVKLRSFTHIISTAQIRHKQL